MKKILKFLAKEELDVNDLFKEGETIRKSEKNYQSKKDNSKIYESLNTNSKFSKNTPKKHIPVVIEEKDENANIISQREKYISQEEAKNSGVYLYEQLVHYPKTGNEYWIEGDKYPEFFEIVDLNHDGKVSLDELGRIQKKFSRIIKKYPEGDIESIVKDFTKNNF